tara:strand:- start:455 stop:601 length:147 start_codon:yes stop_codon:yes gene_type:complete
MKTILEALEFCKDNKLYDTHINIALGINKVPLTMREGLNQLRMRNDIS